MAKPSGMREIRFGRPFVVWFFSIASLALLFQVGYAGWFAFQQPYSGLDWSQPSGRVNGVIAGSPAFESGLQVGDILISMNGQQLDKIGSSYAEVSTTETISLIVERNGQNVPITLHFVPPDLAILFQRILPLIVAFCLMVFGFYVWAHKPYDLTVIIYLTLNGLGAATLTFGLLSTLYLESVNNWVFLSFSFLPATLIHFHSIFPSPKKLPANRYLILTLYGFGLISLFLYYWIQNPTEVALLWSLIRLLFVGAIAYSAGLLVQIYKTTSYHIERQRIRLIVVGTFLAFSPMTIFSLLPDVFFHTTFISYEYTFPFLILISVAYTIAVQRHELLNIDRLVNRSVVYITLSLIVALLYILLSVSFSTFWPSVWSEYPIIGGLATLFLVFMIIPMREKMQAVADRLFYGGWYDYRSAVISMSQAMSEIVSTEELADVLVKRLPQTMHLEGAALVLIENCNRSKLIQTNGWQWQGARFELHKEEGLTDYLRNNPAAQTTAEVRALTTGLDREIARNGWLYSPEIELLVPLVYHENVHGVLLLGTRQGEEHFEPEDRRILSTLAWQAAVTIENIRLIESLRQRSEEVKTLYQQLMHTREDERKRLARELHDQFIQELVDLGFYLETDIHLGIDKANSQFDGVRERIRAMINRLRVICAELRPPALDDLSLGYAMAGYVDKFGAETGMEIDLLLPENEFALTANVPDKISLSLYHVLKEGLLNARNHGKASLVLVELQVETDRITLTIKDNGQGFSPPPHLGSFIREQHYGLTGLQERLDMVQGKFEVISSPGEGTTLKASVPLPVSLRKVG
jgi:signal transduction histidine kinase